MFAYPDTPFDIEKSFELCPRTITVGEVLKGPKIPTTEELAQKVLEVLLPTRDVDLLKISIFVNSLQQKDLLDTFDTSYFEGRYVVTEAGYAGGSTRDCIPPCWHVTAKKMVATDLEVVIEFYQECSDFYRDALPYIEPVGRLF